MLNQAIKLAHNLGWYTNLDRDSRCCGNKAMVRTMADYKNCYTYQRHR